MQTKPLKIQKLFQIYEEYLRTKKRGHLCTIHSMFNNLEVQKWINESNSIGRNLDEKLYLIFHNLDCVELCSACKKIKKFTLKSGYQIDGNDHRKCKKFPFNYEFQNYSEFYGIREFKNTSYLVFIQKFKNKELIMQWKTDHPLFSNYVSSYLLPLFSYIHSENDLNDIPVCKYCGKFKCSINYDMWSKEKKMYFNDYCFDCVKQYRGTFFKTACRRMHGVDNYSKLEHIKDKKKETCIQNLGVDNPMKNNDVKDHRMNACILKYGVKNVSQIPDIKKKKTKSIIDHYGSWEAFIDMSLGEFCRSVGVKNVSQIESVKDKKAETFFSNYGYNNIFADPTFQIYIKQYNLEKYGKESWTQTDWGRRFLREQLIDRVEKQLLNGEPVCPAIGCEERKFLNELQNIISYTIIRNARCIGYFVDGYIAEKNIVIEFDEDFHFDHDGNLMKQDVLRQSDLTEYLKCIVIRIKDSEWKIDKKLILEECLNMINGITQQNEMNVVSFKKRYHIKRKNES
jgi:very-short-patch-repair endonuclease